jgi:hypothetical protein
VPNRSYGKACVLSSFEAERLEKKGIVPNCREHRHVGHHAAEILISTPTTGGRRAARSVCPRTGIKAKPAITFLFSPNWRLSVVSDPSLPSLPGGPRLKTLQLIP